MLQLKLEWMQQKLLLKGLRDLIENEIADKITSIGKPKEKPKTKEKPEEIYIPPKKDYKLLTI